MNHANHAYPDFFIQLKLFHAIYSTPPLSPNLRELTSLDLIELCYIIPFLASSLWSLTWVLCLVRME